MCTQHSLASDSRTELSWVVYEGQFEPQHVTQSVKGLNRPGGSPDTQTRPLDLVMPVRLGGSQFVEAAV
jgi:hypothetical protein